MMKKLFINYIHLILLSFAKYNIISIFNKIINKFFNFIHKCINVYFSNKMQHHLLR